MVAHDDGRDVAETLKAGYGAPPPRHQFVEEVRGRLRQELQAAQASRRRLLRLWRWMAAAAVIVVAVGVAAVGFKDTSCAPHETGILPGPEVLSTPQDRPGRMVPLGVSLPQALFGGTPYHIKPHAHLEKYDSEKARPPFPVPKGTTNLALGKPVTSSDPMPIIGELKHVTDADKEGTDGSYVELGPGIQWVQIDLRKPCHIYAILVWHYHAQGRVYHDVVLQVADDPDFIENVRTIYNNDFDNSAGLGVGKDLEYIEDYRGRLIDAGAVKARYVRLYSNGNTSNDQNHYVEVEVHGKPAPKQVPLKTKLPVPMMS